MFIARVVGAFVTVVFVLTALPILLFFIAALTLFSLVIIRGLRNEKDHYPDESSQDEVIDIEPLDS